MEERLVTILDQESVFWEPQEDITLYEMSVCLGTLFAATGPHSRMMSDIVRAMPEKAQRHFRIVTREPFPSQSWHGG